MKQHIKVSGEWTRDMMNMRDQKCDPRNHIGSEVIISFVMALLEHPKDKKS